MTEKGGLEVFWGLIREWVLGLVGFENSLCPLPITVSTCQTLKPLNPNPNPKALFLKFQNVIKLPQILQRAIHKADPRGDAGTRAQVLRNQAQLTHANSKSSIVRARPASPGFSSLKQFPFPKILGNLKSANQSKRYKFPSLRSTRKRVPNKTFSSPQLNLLIIQFNLTWPLTTKQPKPRVPKPKRERNRRLRS